MYTRIYIYIYASYNTVIMLWQCCNLLTMSYDMILYEL